MRKSPCPTWTYPFPAARPEVRISRSGDPIGTVDCRELHWWFAIPEVGDHTAFASYEIDSLELEAVIDMVATAPARVDGAECVEIQVTPWYSRQDRTMGIGPGVMYGAVGRDRVHWVAIVGEEDGRKRIVTRADSSFKQNWGVSCPRLLQDDGRFEELPDGTYRCRTLGGGGAGVYDLSIGERQFHCLRVLDLTEVRGELVEAYVEGSGRTVFFRRYDGRYYRGTDLLEKYPSNRRIVINGEVYVHCDCSGRAHDTLTSSAIGRAT